MSVAPMGTRIAALLADWILCLIIVSGVTRHSILSGMSDPRYFTAMGWTLLKLLTLHRTIKPELLENPNTLVTAAAAELGAADTTPDNLYMIGTFRLDPDQALVLDIDPPDTRYWNVTLENVWHECLEPRRRHSSVTNSGLSADRDGRVRVAIGAEDFGYGHWLDTGGRHRGFVVLRWLHNPTPPDVRVSVRQRDSTQ